MACLAFGLRVRITLFTFTMGANALIRNQSPHLSKFKFHQRTTSKSQPNSQTHYRAPNRLPPSRTENLKRNHKGTQPPCILTFSRSSYLIASSNKTMSDDPRNIALLPVAIIVLVIMVCMVAAMAVIVGARYIVVQRMRRGEMIGMRNGRAGNGGV